MRTALRIKSAPRSQNLIPKSYPAPIGGWNRRDALANMSPTDAVDLENWFPKTSYVEIRGGNASHATGMSGNGKTLAVYNGLNGTNKMFCTTPAQTYDVSSAGAVGASVAARTDGKHQWVNFGDGTNNYLIMVNGVDKPLYYNGSTWVAVDGVSSPALTGITTTELVNVFVSKGRLYFLANDSLSFWYLAAGAAGGALTEFDLSSFADKGGYLMAGATWTVDGGDGPDDRVVFVTSEGQVIVYAGTNPSSASTWVLVGVYDLGKPLGRRCLTKYGGDLIVLTENGAFPMYTAMQTTEDNNRFALSYKIENAFTDAARAYSGNFGWTSVFYPAQSALLVNVPIEEDGTHEQYVMNTITRSWCKFRMWDAEDFVVFNKELYFCDGSVVYKAWTGKADNGNNIEAYGKPAFSYFGSMGTQKQIVMFRPVFAADGPVSYLTAIDVDFEDKTITGTASASTITSPLWGSITWDGFNWGGALEVVKTWSSPSNYPGYAASGKIKVATNSVNVQWMASDYMFKKGNAL